MKTAVIIPVYNEGERILAPIHATQDYPYIYEVIVVNSQTGRGRGQTGRARNSNAKTTASVHITKKVSYFSLCL